MTTPVGQCPKCRAVNNYAAVSCIHCGARLSWADPVQLERSGEQIVASQPGQPPVAKLVKWVLIIGCVGLVVVFAALVILQIIGVMISGGV